MTQDQISILLDLYNSNSINKTANNCGCTVQTVYYNINSLEKELGVVLINRGQKHSELFTQVGKDTIEQFKIINTCFNNIKRICNNNTIIAGVDANYYPLIAAICDNFYLSHKTDYTIEKVPINSTDDKYELLQNGVIDFVSDYERQIKHFEFIPLTIDDTYIACRKDIFNGKTSVSPDSLKGFRIIFDSDSKVNNAILFNYLENNGIDFTPIEKAVSTTLFLSSLFDEKTVMLIHSNFIHYTPLFLKLVKVENMTINYGIYIRNRTPVISKLISDVKLAVKEKYQELLDTLIQNEIL